MVLLAVVASVQVGITPNSARPDVVSPLPAALVSQIGIEDKETGEEEARDFERCSLFLQDHIGILGVMHYLRPAGAYSCFERHSEAGGSLRLFIAHLAAGLRSALKSQALVKEEGRLAAIFQHSAEGILTVDRALLILAFNPAMELLPACCE